MTFKAKLNILSAGMFLMTLALLGAILDMHGCTEPQDASAARTDAVFLVDETDEQHIERMKRTLYATYAHGVFQWAQHEFDAGLQTMRDGHHFFTELRILNKVSHDDAIEIYGKAMNAIIDVYMAADDSHALDGILKGIQLHREQEDADSRAREERLHNYR